MDRGLGEMTDGRTPEALAVREYIFDDYRIDVAAYQLWRGDHLIPLTPKVFDTLAVLIQHRDRAISKQELLSFVWPDSRVTEDSLTQSISALRRALGDDITHPKLIATIARRGYRFIAPVVEVPVEEFAVKAEPKTVSASPPSPSTSPLEAPALPDGTSNFGLLKPLRGANRDFRNWKAWLGGTLLGAVAVLAIGMVLPQVFNLRPVTRPEVPTLRFSIGAPRGTTRIYGGVLSPNGRYILLLTENDRSGVAEIWIQSLATGQARTIPGTEGASRPFWSPDSQLIGFLAEGKLKRIGINNQTVQVIAPAGTNTSAPTWGSKRIILFAEQRAGLYSVSESGGTPVPVTTLNSKEQEVAHRWPQFLPDGEHFLYFVVSAKPDRTGTYLGSLRSKQAQRLLDVPAIFAAPGYLVYTRDHLLMAQAFDPARPHVRQAPMVIGETVFPAANIDESTLSTANLSVSGNGLLAYTSLAGMPQVKWFDRSGREIGMIDMPVPVFNPVLSPDQNQLLVGSRNLDHGVWLVDLSRGVSTRIVADGMRPLWSPDGAQIAFSADRAGANSLFTKPAAGSNEEGLLLRAGGSKALNDWSPDGRYILYTRIVPDTKYELWLLPLFGDRKPRPFLQAPFNEIQGQISPDGHWVAYASDESGTWEIYLQSFPSLGGKRILSVDGGVEPHWRKDGKELFYLAPDRNLMAVSINLSSSPEIERPHVVFRAPVPPLSRIISNQFAVGADGQRFVFGLVENTSKEEQQLTVLSSWPSLLSH